MIKNVLLFLILFLVLSSRTYSYNVEYKNVVFSSKDIEKLSKSDSLLFSKIIEEYTEYGVELVSIMVSLYGTPYKYGGNTERGIDCSAFTQTVFRRIEYQLPRTAHEQSELGEQISKDSLQLGDLLFFRRGSHITHVGIYLEDGYFIHASTSNRKVCVQTLRNKYYDNFFAFAKRVNT